MAVAGGREAGLSLAQVVGLSEAVLADGRISVREAVGEGFAFWRSSWRQAAVPLAAVALLAVVSQGLAQPISIIADLANLAMVVVVQGALYRLALAGKTEPPLDAPGPLGLQWRRLEWRILGLILLVDLLLLAGAVVVFFVLATVAVGFIGPDAANMTTPEQMAAALGPTGQGVLGALLLAAAIGFIWLMTRLTMAMPATVAEGRIRLFSTWRLTRGHVLPLLGALLLIALPLGVISLLAGMIDAADGDLLNTRWASIVGNAVGLIFYIPISVGLFSHLYLRLRPEGPAAEF